MEMRHCPNCGAPLPMGEPGELERCRFCDAELREERAPRAPEAPVPPRPIFASADLDLDPPVVRRSPSMVIPITGVIVGAAVVVYAILSRTHVTHGKIGTTTLSDRWQPVDVEGAPRTKRIGSFAELAWATSIATRWRSDATLFKMFGTDVGDDGWTTLSGANTSYVEYTFESPSCWSAAGTSPDTCGLNLLLDAPGGHVRVQADEIREAGLAPSGGPRDVHVEPSSRRVGESGAARRTALSRGARQRRDVEVDVLRHERRGVRSLRRRDFVCRHFSAAGVGRRALHRAARAFGVADPEARGVALPAR
jgi:hypothetical protein